MDRQLIALSIGQGFNLLGRELYFLELKLILWNINVIYVLIGNKVCLNGSVWLKR